MIRSILVLTFLFAIFVKAFAQNIDKIINSKEVERIVKFLASDELMGRRAFTPDIEKATDFIANEFKSIGLQTLNNSGAYRQEFSMVTPKQISLSCSLNSKSIEEKNVVVVTSEPVLFINEQSGYEKIKLDAGKTLSSEAEKLINAGKNYIVLVDTSYARNFNRLNSLKRQLFKTTNSVVFVLTSGNPSKFIIETQNEIVEQKLSNVVGVLPGKKLKNEFIIISGHYDHVGTGSPRNAYPHDNTDTIYNGANDDASGTAAVIMLAKYFKELGNNERTIVFVAFTAEELGGYGSKYFSRQFDADKVIAMFNIEMIGTESKWGNNSVYMTGFEKTDMGTILQKNLDGTGFTIYPDPYIQQQLFYRSDNATLARQGVPAHSISTSKMDSEPNYHRVSDEVETLNFENMTQIIKAISLGSKSIISGKDTPTRVKVEELR